MPDVPVIPAPADSRVPVRPAWSRQLHALLRLTVDGELIHRVDAEGRVGYAHRNGRYLPYGEYSEFGALLRPGMVFLTFFTWDVKNVVAHSSGRGLLAEWDRDHPGFAEGMRRRRDEVLARRVPVLVD